MMAKMQGLQERPGRLSSRPAASTRYALRSAFDEARSLRPVPHVMTLRAVAQPVQEMQQQCVQHGLCPRTPVTAARR